VNGRGGRSDRHEDGFETVERILIADSGEWLVGLDKVEIAIDRLGRSGGEVCVDSVVPS
jgi:hypothetical protein